MTSHGYNVITAFDGLGAFRQVVLDGGYRCGADGAAVFVEAVAPSDYELHTLLQTVIARLMKMLTRRGVLIEELGQTWLADTNGG